MFNDKPGQTFPYKYMLEKCIQLKTVILDCRAKPSTIKMKEKIKNLTCNNLIKKFEHPNNHEGASIYIKTRYLSSLFAYIQK